MSVAEFRPDIDLDRPGSGGGPDRTPPQDIVAEQSVLGAMLLSKDAIADVIELIKGTDFYRPAHQSIYEAILDLYGRGEPADPVTVKDKLESSGDLVRAGGAPYLLTLIESVPTAANAGYYARIVRERAILRRLVQAGTRIVQMGYAVDGGDVDEVVDRAQAEVYEVTERRTSEDYLPLSQIMEGTVDEIEAIASHGGAMAGVPTGIEDLDRLTNGLHAGQLVVVAARPGIGKCLAAETVVVEAGSGERVRIDEFVRRGRDGVDLRIHTLDASYRLRTVRPSDFVPNGRRDVFALTTRTGRRIRATANHPFLTLRGWVPLEELSPADRIAVPRAVEAASSVELPDALVALTAYLIGDGSLTSATPRLTAYNPAIIVDATRWARAFGVQARPMVSRVCTDQLCADFIEGHAHDTALSFATAAGSANPLTDALNAWGLMGANSHTKFVPDDIFRTSERQIALFLSRLFATDGWASVQSADEQPQIGYASVSERLARDVQHLLLRLGIMGRLRVRTVAYRGDRRPVWHVEIHDSDQIRAFAARVGIFGKEGDLVDVVGACGDRVANPNVDLIPAEVWELVREAKGARSWADINREAGRPATHNWHVRQAISRHRLLELAKVLESDALVEIATSDVLWDEVASIEPDGSAEVYDLTIDGTHNFVANDIVVHNSTLGLDFARSASIKHGLTSVVFSLEMARNEIVMRMLSAEGRVPLHHMRTGSMSEDDWQRMARRMGEVNDAPLFIDDSPNMSMMEIRAKCRRLKQRNDLRLVIIDYLQLMTSGKRVESRQQEVSEFSRSLKLLAKELEVPVVAISQLNRGAESRTDKKPLLSDLRESGAIEQDADMVILLHREDAYERESPRAGEADLIVAKHRNGPTTTVTVAFQGHYSRFVDMAQTQ